MICQNFKKHPSLLKNISTKLLLDPNWNIPPPVGHWLRQDILKLEKVQHHAVHFVHNNCWLTASVTEIISSLNWETLESHHQKACLCMLFKAINSITKIPTDHYKFSTFTPTRSYHGQNLLLPRP